MSHQEVVLAEEEEEKEEEDKKKFEGKYPNAKYTTREAGAPPSNTHSLPLVCPLCVSCAEVLSRCQDTDGLNQTLRKYFFDPSIFLLFCIFF